MSLTRKNAAKDPKKKLRSVEVTVTKEILFPEKVAEAKKLLSNTKFHDRSLVF